MIDKNIVRRLTQALNELGYLEEQTELSGTDIKRMEIMISVLKLCEEVNDE